MQVWMPVVLSQRVVVPGVPQPAQTQVPLWHSWSEAHSPQEPPLLQPSSPHFLVPQVGLQYAPPQVIFCFNGSFASTAAQELPLI